MMNPSESGAGGYEILIHNLSHSDTVLEVNTLDNAFKHNSIMARPKFSSFNRVCYAVHHVLQGNKKIINMPRSKRMNAHNHKNNLLTNNGSDDDNCDIIGEEHIKHSQYIDLYNDHVPAGFDFSGSSELKITDMATLRFRKDDGDRLRQAIREEAATTCDTTTQESRESNSEPSSPSPACRINSAYFPLISLLLPKWLQSIKEHTSSDIPPNKVMLLITGAGTPADSHANFMDNSTEYQGKMVKEFLDVVYPEIEVIHIHTSDLNIFRYDDNIEFVKVYLNPHIERFRAKTARYYESEWKNNFNLTLSFADGSSARTSAINAAIRLYKPSYMHFWQLKTFWHETKLCDDDLEVHSYAEISTIPAIVLERTSAKVKMVVEEMLRFKAEFTSLRQKLNDPGFRQDLTSFWLRKSKKPVLAVLMVQKDDDDDSTIKLYRGTNMEVSMPTGSLCAERNVIGSALAADLTLRRQDLKYVAVYSACLDPIDSVDTSLAPAPATPSPGRSGIRTITPKLDGSMEGGAGVGVDIDDDGSSPFSRSGSSSSSETFDSHVNNGQQHHHHSHRTMSDISITSNLSVSTDRSARSASASRSNSYSESVFEDGEQGLIDSITPSAPIAVTNMNLHSPGSTHSNSSMSASPAGSNTRRAADKLSSSGPYVKATRQSSRRISNHGMNEQTSVSKTQQQAPLPLFEEFNKSPRSLGMHKESPKRVDKLDSNLSAAPGFVATSTPTLARGSSMSSLSAMDPLNVHKSSLKKNGKAIERVFYTPSTVKFSFSEVEDITSPSAAATAGTGTGTGTGAIATQQRRLGSSQSVTDIAGMTGRGGVVVDGVGVGDSSIEGMGSEIQQDHCSECVGRGVSQHWASRTFYVGVNDMNPLKPCGACNEWLKKIAEVNPQFSVITFTDENCEGVYVEEVDTM